MQLSEVLCGSDRAGVWALPHHQNARVLVVQRVETVDGCWANCGKPSAFGVDLRGVPGSHRVSSPLGMNSWCDWETGQTRSGVRPVMG